MYTIDFRKLCKKVALLFCVLFTVVTLFCSFTRGNGEHFHNLRTASYTLEEVTQNGQKYIVATTSNGGIAICKE